MRIESIQISAFGRFSQVQFGPFSDRFVVIHGSDETGKSTLQAFIRALLFGFPPTDLQAARQVTPTGRYGGRLVLRDAERLTYTVERYFEPHGGAPRLIMPNGASAGAAGLDALLAHVSLEHYQAVFTVGPDDLLSIGSMPDEAASGHMYAAGLGLENLPDVLSRFERQARTVFDPAGRDNPVARTLRELADIDRELALVRAAADRYYELRRRRDELSLDIRAVDFEIAAIGRIEQRIADEERRATGAWEGEPESAVWATRSGYAADSTSSQDDPLPPRRDIDELRESWTRLQAMRGMYDLYRATVARQRLPRSPWFLALLMVGVILPVVIGAVTGHNVILTLGIASAILGMILLVLAAISRSRFEAAQLQAMLHLEMTHREAQGRFLRAALATRIDPERVEAELTRLERIQAQRPPEREREAPGAGGMEREDERPQARAALAPHTRELDAARAEWRALAVELHLPVELAGAPANARAAAEQRRDELLIGRGRLDEQIQQFEDDRRSAELRFERQELLTLLGEQVLAWSTAVLAGRLLKDAARGYGRNRQPEVLRAASDAFDAMTLGAYHRLIALDADGIAAIGRDGREVSVADMSRGVREQAYLALRIGLIRASGRRARPLPVLVDDVLVNFDPERAVEAMRALAGLTPEHQIFLFTSHPSTVALARFVVPGASVVSLGEQKIAGFAPIWLDNA